MRWNCVGTMWLVATRYSSISRRQSSGVHLSMSTTAWPRCSELAVHINTAV